MYTSRFSQSGPAQTNGRWFRWLLAIVVIVNLGSLPIYIYVLEIHSGHLASLDVRQENLGVRISHIEAATYPKPCAPQP